MTAFFTADLHLGHTNIIHHCNRPFITKDGHWDVRLMDKTIIDNWNAVVTSKDVVYVLGDFCHWKGLKADRYLDRLNGAKVLIKGNHDKRDTLNARGWQAIHDRYEYEQEGQMIVLDHYSMRSWNKSFHGSWHLYGHTHGRLLGYGRSFDIGVDSWNFTPVSFYEIRDIMKGLTHQSVYDPSTRQAKTNDSQQPN